MKTSKKPITKILWDYLIIIVACALYSFGFICFYQSNNLSVGGFTGVAQILNYFLPFLPIGTTALVMNIPILILAWKKQGPGLLIGTIFAITMTSLMIDGLNYLFGLFPPMDPLLAGIYGGVAVGVGVGLLMLKGATTGGTELLARLLKRRFGNLSMGRLCMIIDFVVIVLHSVAFGHLENALYGVLAIFVSAQAMDWVIYGGKAAKAVYIMSDKYEEIASVLLKMDFGLTRLQSISGYRGKDTQVIFTVCRRSEIVPIKQTVMEVDEKAFFVVCDAYEVLGEGFGEYSPDGL